MLLLTFEEKDLSMDTNIPATAKLVLFLLVFIPALTVLGFIWFDKKTPNEYYLEEHTKFAIQSKIILIYNDKKNHNTQFLKFRDTLMGVPATWEDKFKVSDSISKKKGSLKLSQFRNGSLIEVFDYNKVKKHK